MSARESKLGNGFTYAVLTIVAITTLVPFVWTVSTSLKPEGSVFSPRPELIPRRTYFEATYEGKRVRVRPIRELSRVLEREGFKVEVQPCWGGTPFANVLLVARRARIE